MTTNFMVAKTKVESSNERTSYFVLYCLFLEVKNELHNAIGEVSRKNVLCVDVVGRVLYQRFHCRFLSLC